jgi:Sjoegren syndrome nuclear autoantigen 1
VYFFSFDLQLGINTIILKTHKQLEMSNISPSALQTFNNEIVKGLDSLRERHQHALLEIAKQEQGKHDLEQEIAKLQAKLSKLNSELAKNRTKAKDLHTLISETETAYIKIVDSSQTLLEIMSKQSKSL